MQLGYRGINQGRLAATLLSGQHHQLLTEAAVVDYLVQAIAPVSTGIEVITGIVEWVSPPRSRCCK